jgi:predicted site-specific integrase-resolvase
LKFDSDFLRNNRIFIKKDTMASSSNTRVYEEEDIPCPACSYGEVEKDGAFIPMIFCDGCNRNFHFVCVGLNAAPRGHWLCGKCQIDGVKPQKQEGVVAYIRVSSKKQNEPKYGRHGLETQRTSIREWARVNNIRISRWIVDVGSGYRNPQNLEITEFVNSMGERRKQKPVRVVVYEPARLSRNSEHGQALVDTMHANGVYFIAVHHFTEGQEGESVTSRDPIFMNEIRMGQNYSEQNSRRARDNHARRTNLRAETTRFVPPEPVEPTRRDSTPTVPIHHGPVGSQLYREVVPGVVIDERGCVINQITGAVRGTWDGAQVIPLTSLEVEMLHERGFSTE